MLFPFRSNIHMISFIFPSFDIKLILNQLNTKEYLVSNVYFLFFFFTFQKLDLFKREYSILAKSLF